MKSQRIEVDLPWNWLVQSYFDKFSRQKKRIVSNDVQKSFECLVEYIQLVETLDVRLDEGEDDGILPERNGGTQRGGDQIYIRWPAQGWSIVRG